MREVGYDRAAAAAYAGKWALGRNPAYADFQMLGGDCTNFISQCLFAGAGVMNYTRDTGWYYVNLSNRSPSWTGVEYLQRFLLNNRGVGPYARRATLAEAEIGDVVQLADLTGDWYHSLLITETEPRILVCAHTYDALDRPLASYRYDAALVLHIAGVRAW